MSDAQPTAPEQREPEPAPPSDPNAFRLRGEPPRVMRLSRKALAIVGAIAGLGIGGALIYALMPVTRGVAVNLYDTESRSKAEVVTAAPSDYAKIPKLGAPLPGDLGKPILAAARRDEGMVASPAGLVEADPRRVAIEQLRERAAQERDAARMSRLFSSAGTKGQGPEATGDLADITAILANSGKDEGREAVAAADDAAGGNSSAQAGRRDFLRTDTKRPTVSDQRIVPPTSPYVLQAGSIIPAALITGIRSDLPGQITAQVTQNVYDSPTGRILLVPQGARLVGAYDSTVSNGQARVLLAWDRLILPGGRSISLDRQPGADPAGMVGLQDRTDFHWGAMLKAALVSTLLGIGAELTTGSDDELTRALRYGTQDTVNQTGRQVVQRQLDVPPTLTIRPGHPLRVIVTRDLILEPIAMESPQ